jgi:hypothetical protein
VIGAVLALTALTACSDDPSGETPVTPDVTSAPSISPSPSVAETSAAEEVTDAQKKACLDAIIEQIRAKKGGDKPVECEPLPADVLATIIEKALSGG